MVYVKSGRLVWEEDEKSRGPSLEELREEKERTELMDAVKNKCTSLMNSVDTWQKSTRERLTVKYKKEMEQLPGAANEVCEAEERNLSEMDSRRLQAQTDALDSLVRHWYFRFGSALKKMAEDLESDRCLKVPNWDRMEKIAHEVIPEPDLRSSLVLSFPNAEQEEFLKAMEAWIFKWNDMIYDSELEFAEIEDEKQELLRAKRSLRTAMFGLRLLGSRSLNDVRVFRLLRFT